MRAIRSCITDSRLARVYMKQVLRIARMIVIRYGDTALQTSHRSISTPSTGAQTSLNKQVAFGIKGWFQVSTPVPRGNLVMSYRFNSLEFHLAVWGVHSLARVSAHAGWL